VCFPGDRKCAAIQRGTGSGMPVQRGSAARVFPARPSHYRVFMGHDSLHTSLARLPTTYNTHAHSSHTHTHMHTHTYALILMDVEELGHFVQIGVFLSVLDNLAGGGKAQTERRVKRKKKNTQKQTSGFLTNRSSQTKQTTKQNKQQRCHKSVNRNNSEY